MLVDAVTLHMASGAPIGPFERPGHVDYWSTSMLRLQVERELGIVAPLSSVRFSGTSKQDWVTDDDHVDREIISVVIDGAQPRIPSPELMMASEGGGGW